MDYKVKKYRNKFDKKKSGTRPDKNFEEVIIFYI